MQTLFKLCLTLVILFIGIISFSQENKTEEVHLKNGSMIKGVITENNTDSIVTIRTKDNNIYVVKRSEIKEIKTPTKDSVIKNRSPHSLSFDAGFLGFGTSYTNGIVGSLMVKASYQFKDRYFVALASGIESFGMPIVPLCAEIQADIFKRNVTPFIYARGGYAFAVLPDEGADVDPMQYQGGILLASGLGIKTYISTQFSMYFTVGYRHQRTVQENLYDYYYGTVDRQFFYNRIAFRIGLIF